MPRCNEFPRPSCNTTARSPRAAAPRSANFRRRFMFRSFFLAGFEGTTASNLQHVWIDQIAATGHDRDTEADYRRLRETGLLAARESIRWPLVDQRGKLDF